MARKKRETSITLPGLFWDSEAWVEPSRYPNYTIFTDRILAKTLGVSPMRVQSWRTSGVIPCNFSGSGSYAVYNLNDVLKALKSAGYVQDPNLKSQDYEK